MFCSSVTVMAQVNQHYEEMKVFLCAVRRKKKGVKGTLNIYVFIYECIHVYTYKNIYSENARVCAYIWSTVKHIRQLDKQESHS